MAFIVLFLDEGDVLHKEDDAEFPFLEDVEAGKLEPFKPLSELNSSQNTLGTSKVSVHESLDLNLCNNW